MMWQLGVVLVASWVAIFALAWRYDRDVKRAFNRGWAQGWAEAQAVSNMEATDE